MQWNYRNQNKMGNFMKRYGIYIIILYFITLIFLFYITPRFAFLLKEKRLFFIYSFIFSFVIFFLAYLNLEITMILLKNIRKYLELIDNQKLILAEKWYYNFLERYYDNETKILFIFLFPFSLISNYYYINQDLSEIRKGKFCPHKKAIYPFLWLTLTLFASLFVLPLVVAIKLFFSKKFQNLKMYV